MRRLKISIFFCSLFIGCTPLVGAINVNVGGTQTPKVDIKQDKQTEVSTHIPVSGIPK